MRGCVSGSVGVVSWCAIAVKFNFCWKFESECVSEWNVLLTVLRIVEEVEQVLSVLYRVQTDTRCKARTHTSGLDWVFPVSFVILSFAGYFHLFFCFALRSKFLQCFENCRRMDVWWWCKVARSLPVEHELSLGSLFDMHCCFHTFCFVSSNAMLFLCSVRRVVASWLGLG